MAFFVEGADDGAAGVGLEPVGLAALAEGQGGEALGEVEVVPANGIGIRMGGVLFGQEVAVRPDVAGGGGAVGLEDAAAQGVVGEGEGPAPRLYLAQGAVVSPAQRSSPALPGRRAMRPAPSYSMALPSWRTGSSMGPTST